MTKREFLAALRKTPRKWHQTGTTGVLRCESGDCPITAVYRLATGRRIGTAAYASAAAALGLPLKTARPIAYAADGDSTVPARYRSELLRACGLSK